MNVLAFDTCFDACSVAAGRALRSLSPSIATYFEPMAAGHAERLMPMIDAALADTRMKIADLDRIAITLGPGTFTGTRISVAAGRALALAAGVPLVAITSFALMAMNARANATGAEELVIATDARRGEIYFERFDPHSLHSLSPAAALPAEEAAALLGEKRVVAAGSGAEALKTASRAPNIRAIAPTLLPDAVDMLFPAIQLPTALRVHALYLRSPDAKPPLGAALARSGL